MGWLAHERYEAEFEAETARLGAVAVELGPAAAVPTCPEWTVRELVKHVGTGHRWAAEIVERRLDVPAPYPVHDAPQDPDSWVEWLAAGAGRLAEAVRAAGPDQPVWTWQADRTAGFWLRRMLHDELVHRFDAEIAAGRLGDVAPDLAADGVSDALATAATLSGAGSHIRSFRRLVGTGQTLRLRATDPGLSIGEWLTERGPDGVRWLDGPSSANVDVAVDGPARELLLVLNRRLEPERAGLTITGDGALFTQWLEHTRF
jgi:uncharacterized protein (TIGR03083 family)